MKKTMISSISTNVNPAKSIEYNNMVYELKQQDIDVVVLSLGEAYFDLPLFSFDDLPFPDIYHYSHSRGIIELRISIAKYFCEEYGVNFDPEREIVVTAGSKIAIHMALMAILNPGDEVLIYEPYWVSYTEQVKLCNAIPVTIPIGLDLHETEKYVTSKTKCIIVNTPNNPMGKIYSREELQYLLDLVKRKGIMLFSDEAYSDFVPAGEKFVSLGSIDKSFENSVIFNSISKNYGISGWRLGYSITNQTLTDEILKINQHLITCPATILEYYMAKHFFEIIEITKPQIVQVVKFRKSIQDYMDKIGLSYLPGKAAWYFLVSIEPSTLTSDEFCWRLLKNNHISIVPGSGYGKSCDNYFRLAVGSESYDRITDALDVIKDLIFKTSE